jgi:hypothetical protein
LKNLYEHFLLFSNTEALCRRLLEAWRPYYQRLQDYRRHCETKRNDESDISIITQSRALEKTMKVRSRVSRHTYKYYDEALNALFKAKQYLWYTIAYNDHLECRVYDRQETIISNSRANRQKQKDMCESSLLLERIQCGDALQRTTGIVFTGHMFPFTDDCLQRSDDRFTSGPL